MKTPQNKTLIYLAVPYTHKNKEVEARRYERITVVSGIMVSLGFYNISPITQSHVQQEMVELETTWNFWKKVDTLFLERSDEIWVLMLEGWKESVGVQAEIAIAKKLKLPVRYIKPKPTVFDDEDDNSFTETFSVFDGPDTDTAELLITFEQILDG